MDPKRINVLFIQETHSTDNIVSNWKRDFKAKAIFSYNFGASEDVGNLFLFFLLASYSFEEIILMFYQWL